MQPAGYVQLGGGYQPNPPQGVPVQQAQQQGMPQMPQQQGQMQQAPALPQMPWTPPGPQGAPLDGAPPPQFQQQPQRQPQPQQFQQAPMQQPQYAPQTVPGPWSPAMPQQPQPGQYPSQPQFYQAPPQQPQLDPNARLSGPSVPPELQGKTVSEALGIYSGMRQVTLQSIQNRPQPQMQPQQQPNPFPQQQGLPGLPGQQPQQGGWDWRNPQAEIARVVQEQLAPVQQMLQPIVMRSQLDSVKAARDSIAQQIGPQFASIEPQVIERLRGADPQQLSNPEMWRVATQSVVGEMALRGQLPQGPVQQQQQPQFNQWLQPAQRPQPGQQPLPNLNGFFTEQPQSGMPMGSQPGQLTQNQLWAAQAMGMNPQDYSAWSAGVPSGGLR